MKVKGLLFNRGGLISTGGSRKEFTLSRNKLKLSRKELKLSRRSQFSVAET